MIKVGGTISYKVQIAQYESLEVSAVIEIDEDFKSIDDADAAQEVINEKLKAQVNKRMEIAVRNYHERIEKLKKMV